MEQPHFYRCLIKESKGDLSIKGVQSVFFFKAGYFNYLFHFYTSCVKLVIPNNYIIRHFTYLAYCLHVSEDDCWPSKHMARKFIVVLKE